MRYRILPYRQGSKGAKALADALGGKVLRLEGSTFVPKAGDKIINWGNTSSPVQGLTPPPWTVLNWAKDIRNASNKLLFFRLMRETNPDLIPEFWENQDDIPDTAFSSGIVCRTVLAGHSGDGIVIASNRSELVPASLYVKYIKKSDEYRIHVGQTEASRLGAFAPEIIAVQRKARRLDHANPNWQVRNHANGFIYARDGVVPPSDVSSAARRALVASGLDFGAVDVIWNQEKARAYVLEINTAPGLEGQTVTDYANFFRAV